VRNRQHRSQTALESGIAITHPTAFNMTTHLNDQDITHLCTLLREATTDAIAASKPEQIHAEHKADGSWVTATDHAIQSALAKQLQARFPDVAFMGEEMPAALQQSRWDACRQGKQALWVVDPLDGTSNFRARFPVFASTLCLLEGGVAVFGAVYDPTRDELFYAHRGHGAWLNQQRLDLSGHHEQPLKNTLAGVDFKRLPAALAAGLATNPPFGSQRSIGSIALDWCWLAAGRIQVYVHGKQKLWDYAAAQLILFEAGGFSATLCGSVDKKEPILDFQPRSAVAATSLALLEQWRQALVECSQKPQHIRALT